MTQEKITSVENFLNNLSNDDIINIWNRYCEDTRRDDDEVMFMDSMDELFHDSDPLWLLQRAYYGNFNPNEDYFILNGYGNFVSFSYWDDNDSPISIDEDLVTWFVEEFEDRNDYISEDDIAEDFVDYINDNLGTNLSISEIYDLSDKAGEIENPEGEIYDLDTILNDDWDMWLANVKEALAQENK